MKCCYGLVKTDIDDLQSVLQRPFVIAHEVVSKSADVVVALGIKTVSRNLEKLKSSRVLVLDTKVRFRGYTIPILDETEAVTEKLLLKALDTPTKKPAYRPMKAPSLIMLKKLQERSIMHIGLKAKYKTTNPELQQKFMFAFLQALDGNEKPMRELSNPVGLQLLHWLKTSNGKNLVAAINSGLPVEEAAEKFNVVPFDLRYIESMRKPIKTLR